MVLLLIRKVIYSGLFVASGASDVTILLVLVFVVLIFFPNVLSWPIVIDANVVK